jgi:hypothetical protein
VVVSIAPGDGGEPVAGWGVSERLTTGGAS